MAVSGHNGKNETHIGMSSSIGLTFYDIIWTSILSSSEPWSLKTAALTFTGGDISGTQF